MSYELQGHFLEACDCNAVCPCWIDDEPDEEECTGLFVWDIDRGVIDGNDVSGMRVASVSFHERKRSTSHQRVVVFVDTRAADDIADALGEVFTGKRGGTLGELGHLMHGNTRLSITMSALRSSLRSSVTVLPLYSNEVITAAPPFTSII